MNETESYLKRYDFISEDIKFAANSLIRLTILAALFEKPQTIKELATNTKLNYSSISATLNGLELKEFIYRESNKYHLSNLIEVQMVHILELNEVINLLEGIFNIIQGHIVEMIPINSVRELQMLKNAELLESSDVDAYKIYNFVENALKDANEVQCILPVYHVAFNRRFNFLVRKGKFLEVYASDEVYDIYERRSKIKYLFPFKGKNNFMLILTDKIMILGFFKDNGQFDQNRLLTSKNGDCMRWANELFVNFKNKNK